PAWRPATSPWGSTRAGHAPARGRHGRAPWSTRAPVAPATRSRPTRRPSAPAIARPSRAAQRQRRWLPAFPALAARPSGGRSPGADSQGAPDYVAAFLAAPRGTDACIVAGTGSVVCSRAADGGYRVSGGRGWILGDHGSAARLGRAALEHFVNHPAAVPASFT